MTTQPITIVGLDEKEAAVERLAQELHFKMEHLDPTEDAEWELLTDHQKDFYLTCVKWLLGSENDIRIAIGLPQ